LRDFNQALRPVTVGRSTVVGNHATVRGGGIENRGQLTISRSRIIANIPDDIAPPDERLARHRTFV
jgi:hypothetical protein